MATRLSREQPGVRFGGRLYGATGRLPEWLWVCKRCISTTSDTSPELSPHKPVQRLATSWPEVVGPRPRWWSGTCTQARTRRSHRIRNGSPGRDIESFRVQGEAQRQVTVQ